MATKDYSAYIGAESTNLSKNTIRTWKDLDSTFTAHPATADVNRIFDVESVKRSVKHLVLTNFGERLFQPWIGSNIRALLFENFDPFVAMELEDTIRTLLENFEPRAEIIDLKVTDLPNRNELRIILNFKMANFPSGEVFQLETFLKRIK